MRIDEFFDALGEIDEEMVTKAKSRIDDPIKVRVERVSWRPFAAVAACLAVAVIGIAVFIGVNSRRDEIVKPDSGSGSVSAEYPESARYQYTGDFSELELNAYACVDRMVYTAFDELEKASDLIVVGTFVDNARQNVPLTGSIPVYSHTMTRGSSFNKLRIDEVYKGDIEIGSQIVICDSYYVNGGKLSYVDGATSTPMIKGEQWVYFLKKVSPEYGDYYFSVGDYDGRFYVPGNENTFVLKDMGDSVGYEPVYDDVKIMLGLASRAQKLDIEDWSTETCEFTMPEFIGDTFVKREMHIYVSQDNRSRLLFAAPRIVSVYFADLNGDGKREIVSECWNGLSGLSANFIIAYDHANSKLYVLEHPSYYSDMLWDYGLEIRDGVLYAIGHSLGGGSELSAEPLTLEMMIETELRNDQIAYEGKTYTIVKSLYTDEGVRFMIGLTKPEYEAGEYVELLGVVENNSGKEIELRTPVTGGKYNFEFGTVIRMGDDQLYETGCEGYGIADALGSTIVKPGESFRHAMRFDTLKERLDDKDTIIPLCKPLGVYSGTMGITLLSDPHNTISDGKHYSLDFEVGIARRGEVEAPERGVFIMDEFGDYVTFMYNRQGLWYDDSLQETEIFSGMPIENLYLIDLNGDGYRELCANVCIGSGIIDSRIMVYDFNSRKLYELSDRGYYDYRMRVENGFEGYVPYAQKLKYATNDLVKKTALTLDIMTEVTEPNSAIRESVKGVTEITGFDKTFTMEEFSDKTFYVGERMLKAADKNGGEELFNTKIVNVYLCDLNGDGRREIIVKGFCNVLNGNTGITSYDAEKIITVIDVENEYGTNLFPGSRDCSLVIIKDVLYISIDGEVEPEPLTYERFEELAKSL